MITRTLHASSIKKIIQRIDNCLVDGFKPSLAFIYASSTFNIEKLAGKLLSYDFYILGATTAGEVYANAMDGVHEVDDSIVCMLIEVNSDALAFTSMEIEGKNSYDVGVSIGLWANKCFKESSIITLTSGLAFDNDAYVQGILSQGVEYIFGGVAGDGVRLLKTFVFSHGHYSNNGIVVLAMDKQIIDVVGARAFGWAGIGKERIVTHSDKNIVYKIDGKSAIDFYKNYLNIGVTDMPQIGIEYPLEVRMRNGQIIYRAVLEIDEEKGALIFAGHVEENARVRISAPKGKSIIQDVSKSIPEVLDKAVAFKPEVALVFPCCSRKQVLGYLTSLEIEAVYNASKVPLIGFFAYGEIGAFPGGYGFHNETFVTMFLSERRVDSCLKIEP
ncbi:MAG: hypothetical protein KU29_10160 [Sulfurovum sp. FS06-10]|jgi:hypothetical protein|nr:MAG: hypothetical protein KU29_13305 [Sulfurovum sp. FS06-10]KIM04866.1 MAG: hypothetical protein KU29_10160 [Sulfurovum sp. FS06-10]